MSPPRLRLVRPDELLAPDPAASGALDAPPSLADRSAPPAPVPTDSPAPVPTDSPAPVPKDSPAPVPTDSPAPVPTDSPTPPPALRLVSPSPVLEDSPPAPALVAELDALLAALALGRPLDGPGHARLIALALRVPGRQRLVTAALGHLASPDAVLALRALPPTAPGVLDALRRCFAHGAAHPPVPEDSSPRPLVALDFRGSRARGFPDLVARAQAIAARSPAADLDPLDLDGRRHYRLTFWTGRGPAAALAAQLRAAHLDLVWLHGRLARLRGTRLWLGGWRFDADDPLGPAVQAHLLQAWLNHAEQAS